MEPSVDWTRAQRRLDAADGPGRLADGVRRLVEGRREGAGRGAGVGQGGRGVDRSSR